jgi:DNA helicase II / ATP-dependent DNA helicase PcrA
MANPQSVEVDEAEQTIVGCLNVEQPKSFFLYAGAGSGKTRSLVSALDKLRNASGQRLRFRGQQVSVITYTNAACDEIKRRLHFDPVVCVSTVHSFVWELIKGFDSDIRKWLEQHLTGEIAELQEALQKGRAGTKTALERARSIESKAARLNGLPSIRRFIYSPTGDNRTSDSLNHSEVIEIGASFLVNKPVMRRLLVSGSPIVLIDESQDTNKLLMEALLAVQAEQASRFGLGLFGDTMQRIYADGKADLGESLRSDWLKPAKTLNYRCPRRIIRLINQIRSSTDKHTQRPCAEAPDGHVRLFVAPSSAGGRPRLEERARGEMAKVTSDAAWNDQSEVKTLILEHHMAARRMGFLEMFEPLASITQFQTMLRDGTLPFLRFFSELALPVVKAQRNADQFAIAAIVRNASPLLRREAFVAAKQQVDQLKAAKLAVDELASVCHRAESPTYRDVLTCIANTNLFEVPDALFPFASAEQPEVDGEDGKGTEEGERTLALRKFLDAPFFQIEPYANYVSGSATFGTHQGVKGLEFPRVLVVMDDEEARGFMFSYEKLFGVKEKTKGDLENEKTGKETAIDRTRRLFYVTCSRSEESLAIVAYTSEPQLLQKSAIGQGWFDANEISLIA